MKIEVRGEISLYNSTINSLFQTLLFIQIFGKVLETISLSQSDPCLNQYGHISEEFLEPCQAS